MTACGPRFHLCCLLVAFVIQLAVGKFFYKELQVGSSITGTIATELETKSARICLNRCQQDANCLWCQFLQNESKNCLLIHEDGETTVTATVDGLVYKKDTENSCETKTMTPGHVLPPGVNPIRYWSFDNDDDIILNDDALIVDDGKVNKAVSTDGDDDWVDLGFVTDACITRPDTCGPEGAALAVWIITPPEQPLDFAGYFSSVGSYTSGVEIHPDRPVITFRVTTTRYFQINIDWQTGWRHVVLNYIGPNEGEGIQIYIDGAEVSTDTQRKGNANYTPGDGRVVIGRKYTDYEHFEGEVKLDELMMFNHKLSEQQVQELYDSYQ